MIPLSIPFEAWLLIAAFALLVGLACICIGTPGRTLLKTSLLWYCLSWALCCLDLAIIAVYLHYELSVPVFFGMVWMITVQIFIISTTYFFYAAAEKEGGLHLKAVLVIAGTIIVLTPFFERLYAWDDEAFRMGLVGAQMIFGGGGCCIYLMQAYRESPPNSSRRKRVFIILSLLTFGAFVVFIPIQVFGQLLGLLDNPMRTAGYAQFTIVASILPVSLGL